MNISIVVTTYNRPDVLARVLDALAHQTQSPDEVVVADDGSDERTANLLKDMGPGQPFRLLHVWHEDEGFRAAKIRNDAIRNASGAYIVFLDGDCVPSRHFVQDHLRLARRGCFFQGKRVLVNKGPSVSFDRTDADTPRRLIRLTLSGGLGNAHHLIRWTGFPPIPSPGLSGTRSCNMGVFRSDLFAVNGFNEAFVGWGREDTELVVRLYRIGLKRITHPFMAVCFHLCHGEHSRGQLAENEALLRKSMGSNDAYTPEGLVKGS